MHQIMDLRIALVNIKGGKTHEGDKNQNYSMNKYDSERSHGTLVEQEPKTSLKLVNKHLNKKTIIQNIGNNRQIRWNNRPTPTKHSG